MFSAILKANGVTFAFIRTFLRVDGIRGVMLKHNLRMASYSGECSGDDAQPNIHWWLPGRSPFAPRLFILKLSF